MEYFEESFEKVRYRLLNGEHCLTKDDIDSLNRMLVFYTPIQLLSVARLCEPMLANPYYKEEAANLIRKLLIHSDYTVRHSALETISWGLGDCPIADTLLAEAKVLLANESVQYVKDYLDNL
jgi:hypothetical protein